ncbi:protein TOO MANY MOUTHS-like isoform X1 [Cucurbita moschata]|uniref:Protein TOO MANY MOUTHS-like isoform X1 n=1 Tax=Cucurbita moschata TaxID=3662 RepID=A0A6J1FYL7_CUCMO|nr:protein TOO MANY MOUTHS-like isoform X1 [Cucurbita moschata]
MLCFFPHSLLLLLLLPLFSLPSASSSSTMAAMNVAAPNSMLPFEAETLFKIMESLSSDQNWRLSHPNPCQPGASWPGLECISAPNNSHLLHVSRLHFGTSPNPTCKPTATFPSFIFDLPLLHSLFFFNCFTHTNTTLSVSPTAFLNSSLQQLSFRSNPALVGPIPPRLSSLKSLKILTLSQNCLSGTIPPQIFGLVSLLHLDLSYNLLTGTIPIQLGKLRSLEGLDLSYNSLTGPIPTSIGQLGLLQKLDLSSNSLTGNIPDTIEKVNSLVFLALSSNQLGGHFPKGLEKLQNLQYFIMDDNPMQIPLPLAVGKLMKLQELRLASCGYSGIIPPSFSLLKNLTTLSLQNNHLSGQIPVGFSGLSHIYHLNLSRNSLTGAVPFNSSFLKRLGKNLDLSGNPGLCFSPSEPTAQKIGVNVCGSNQEDGSFIQPMNESTAKSSFCNPFAFVICLFLHHLIFHYDLIFV